MTRHGRSAGPGRRRVAGAVEARGVRRRPRRQRGAALLLAMLILTLVATLAAGMVWQQWRGIEVEAAERTRSQGLWLLNGALDWARLILREDRRNGGPDHLGEPWALPLAESRLSTFLAADKNNTVDDDGPEAFLSGRIVDAQSRLNLLNLVHDDGAAAQKDLQALQRLCTALGLPGETAGQIATGLRASGASLDQIDVDTPDGKAQRSAMLLPDHVGQLAWYGVPPPVVAQLAPFVALLPTHTSVNVNTAPAEVLMAAVAGLDRGSAERVIQMRQRKPFATAADISAALPPALTPDATQISFNSDYFEVQGQLRFEQHVLRERSLVFRKGLDMIVLRRERMGPQDS